MTALPLTHRDRSVLRAVAAGRCSYASGTLLVDGLCCCDQFVGPRLAQAGLIGTQPGPARLTPTGQVVLESGRAPASAA
ncbi:hypothetical protein ACQPZF_13615 [Actinosynnema sp. CS-041913]|uniref:hypothetical protein n=1 Tax=Actinosynnema sp. CS-041913 TaxID=3239917 RepID=UPI003D8B41FC